MRELCPPGYTREGIDKALCLSPDADIVTAAIELGNGSGVSSPDTVPLCLWVASRRQGRYEDALWETVTALGDRDTTCAIVGGILAMSTEVPEPWLALREPIP